MSDSLSDSTAANQPCVKFDLVDFMGMQLWS